VGKLQSMTSVYESFYVASNQGHSWAQVNIFNLTLISFNVLSTNQTMYTGLYASHNPRTPIESYVINESLCTNTEKAHAVTSDLNTVTSQLQTGISAVCFAVVFTNVGNMLMITAVYNFFWMNLTKGYVFDEAFDSKRLRAVIRSKRLSGIVMMFLGLSFVILGALNKLIFYGHF